jgi:hypothetical protein
MIATIAPHCTGGRALWWAANRPKFSDIYVGQFCDVLLSRLRLYFLKLLCSTAPSSWEQAPYFSSRDLNRALMVRPDNLSHARQANFKKLATGVGGKFVPGPFMY